MECWTADMKMYTIFCSLRSRGQQLKRGSCCFAVVSLHANALHFLIASVIQISTSARLGFDTNSSCGSSASTRELATMSERCQTARNSELAQAVRMGSKRSSAEWAQETGCSAARIEQEMPSCGCERVRLQPGARCNLQAHDLRAVHQRPVWAITVDRQALGVLQPGRVCVVVGARGHMPAVHHEGLDMHGTAVVAVGDANIAPCLGKADEDRVLVSMCSPLRLPGVQDHVDKHTTLACSDELICDAAVSEGEHGNTNFHSGLADKLHHHARRRSQIAMGFDVHSRRMLCCQSLHPIVDRGLEDRPFCDCLRCVVSVCVDEPQAPQQLRAGFMTTNKCSRRVRNVLSAVVLLQCQGEGCSSHPGECDTGSWIVFFVNSNTTNARQNSTVNHSSGSATTYNCTHNRVTHQETNSSGRIARGTCRNGTQVLSQRCG
jgi:hypothetical protein